MMNAAADVPHAGPEIDHLETLLDLNYAWGYEDTRVELRDLYRRARRRQWNPDEVLDFGIDVDPEADNAPPMLHPLYGSPYYEKMSPREHAQTNVEMGRWTLSQFLHGEQGALMAASQLVPSVPDMDSKLYAATQVVDEARHVEVFHKYLSEKLEGAYPINPYLKELLDLILKDSRWDMKVLGMQIMVEGLALSAFGLMRANSTEPLLVELTRYVMMDEARHVAYGVLALRDLYADMSESEIREREDFIYEAAVLMRDRFLMDEVWETLGLPVEECRQIVLHNPAHTMFRQMLFSKVVPAIKRIGLLSDRQRQRFQDLGILHFESASDPFEELEREEAAPL
jgi:hypothetical protein